MTTTDHPDKTTLFPAAALPGDPGDQKLIGLYPQHQDGRWMQRVKIPGGRPSADQWRTLAMAAERFSPGTPLAITTRQDIELHNLSPDAIGPLHAMLDSAGLTTLTAAGDTMRNIVVCPCEGTAGPVELFPLAILLDETIQTLEGIYALPRKFKISLSCSPTCGRPWMHDLGLVATQRDGQWGFDVIIAGSLGARPATGVRLTDWLPAEQVVPLAVALIKIFADHGDRENRRKARLRHVRERLDDEPFLAMVRKGLATELQHGDWPAATLTEMTPPQPASTTLRFARGQITPAQADGLAQLVEAGLAVRLDVMHAAQVFAADEQTLTAALAGQPSLSIVSADAPRVMSCPGRAWCKHALAETYPLADAIEATLASHLPAGATVCISGCPNGCSHSAIADVGLVGGKRDGENVFTLLQGGQNGTGPKLATRIATGLSVEEVLAALQDARA